MRIINTLAVAVLFGAVAASGAVAQDVHRLKVATFTPPTDFINADVQAWAKELTELSNGRLVLDIFPAGQMGPGPRHFELARTGVADIAVILHGLTPGRFPMTELTHLPGVLSDPLCGAQALSELAPKYLADENPGVKVLNYVAVYPLPIASRVPIAAAQDLKGKRIRAAGSVQSEMLSAVGAVPVLVAPGDLNDSLAKGSIDAVSVGYSGIAAFKLADVAKQIVELDLGGVTFATVMNRQAFDKLPSDLAALIEKTSGVIGSKRITNRLVESEASVKKKLQGGEMKFVELDRSTAVVKDAEEKVLNLQLKAVPDANKGREFLAEIKKKCAR